MNNLINETSSVITNRNDKMESDSIFEQSRKSNSPKIKRNRTINLRMSVCLGLLLTLIIPSMMTSCKKEQKQTVTATERYETVPLSCENVAQDSIAKESKNWEIIHSAYDDNWYYYVILLGHVNKVPILFRDPVVWDGTISQGITIGYSKSEATAERISKALTTAFSESVSKSQELNYGATVSAEFGGGVSAGIVSANWKTSLGASIGGATVWGNETTRSKTSTIETATEKANEMTDSYEFTVMGDDPHGRYRWTLFGTTDVYYVVRVDKAKTKIEDFYIAYLARPETYIWGVDFDPDIVAGTFGRTAIGSLLEIPKLTLSELPTPTSNQLDNIPRPARPEANIKGDDFKGDGNGDDIKVTLTCINTDAKIYYTTDGSTPTEKSTLYTNPIKISSSQVSTTLKAIAIRSTSPASEIMIETYNFSRKRETVTKTFNFKIGDGNGSANPSGKGDSEVGSEKGKRTDWSFNVVITPSSDGRQAKARFTYIVKEKKGDSTVLTLEQEETITLNKNDIQILEPHSYNISGSIYGENHIYNPVNSGLGSPLTALEVRIDGKGDDENNIGASGTLTFKYSHQP